MSEPLVINDLDFELRRSNRRKTVGITVDRGGELILYAPEDCPLDIIRETVNEKRFWIYTKLAQKEMLLSPGRKREFVSGEGFLYLGRSYRLRLVQAKHGQAPLRLFQGWFEFDRRELGDAKSHFIRWYINHAKPWLERRIGLYENRIGVTPNGINITELGSRWGSCSRNGKLNFHWRTILLPPRIVEYVIVHELIHLIEPHHTTEFWILLERTMPDFPVRKKWLAENGVSADI